MAEKRTFTECLRYNIEHNWNEGGLFEEMTKNDCLSACKKLAQLQAELDLFNALDENSWDLRCVDIESGDEYFIEWLVVEHYMDALKGRQERPIGHGTTPQEAIKQSLKGGE